MAVKSLSSPSGGQARTRVLVALRLLDSSYPRELSRLLDIPVSAASRALANLERDALVAGRLVGRNRTLYVESGLLREARARGVPVAACRGRYGTEREDRPIVTPTAANRQTTVRLTPTSTLPEVAATVGGHLRERGIEAVLTGGACVFGSMSRAHPVTRPSGRWRPLQLGPTLPRKVPAIPTER
jgi:DNA-binding transcriptional ArsR family regulator